MEILGSFRIFSYSKKWNWRFPILSVPYWVYQVLFFFPHNIFFKHLAMYVRAPWHQECILHQSYERYYLAVPMQFSNAVSWH